MEGVPPSEQEDANQEDQDLKMNDDKVPGDDEALDNDAATAEGLNTARKSNDDLMMDVDE